MDTKYKSKYGDSCECPYCGANQDVEVDLDSNAWNEEIECEKCEGKFNYNLEVTVDFACHPIEGEGPRVGEDGQPIVEPRFNDPNQVNLLDLV